ncbi:MAG: PAS domain S-box protein [Proteobacteria bacterium]|nr:PAS domain S-box protein [Pseudomonadota bacterium]
MPKLSIDSKDLDNDKNVPAASYTGQLFSVLDHFPGIAYLQAEDYSIRYANAKFIEQYGEPGEKTCYGAIWGRTRPCEDCPTFSVFKTNEPVVWEASHADGRTYKVYDYPFVAPDGEQLVLEMSIDETGQHNAELELDRVKETYRGIFQNSQVGLARTRISDGKFLELNNHAVKMFGYSTPEEFIKERFGRQCFAERSDRERFDELLARDGHVENFVARARRKNGSTFWVQFSAQRDPENEYLDVVIVNIDKEKRAEGELKEAKETYQGMFQNSLVGLSRTRLSDGKFMEFNDRLVTMFGYADREDFALRYNAVKCYAQPGERERLLGLLKEDGKVENFITLARRKDGSTFWIQLSARIDKEKGYVDVVSLDADTEIKAKEEIRVSEEKYRALFEESNDVVFVTTPEGSVLDMNPAGLKLFGYTIEEARRLDLATDLYNDPAVRAEFKAAVLKDGSVKNFELEVKTRSGTVRTGVMSANAVWDDDGNITKFRGIFHDMTERKRLENQLLHSQKMEAIGRLAGGIAHDFNNILTVTKTLADLATAQVEADDPMMKYLKPISESSDRATSLVQQLLLFSQNRPPSTTETDLNRAITSLLGMLEHLISEDISITTNLETDLWKIEADNARLEQLITNLVVNASEAMSGGGSIEIRTWNTPETKKECCSMPEESKASKQHVCLEVTDTGVGMDSSVIEHIFEPFFTTDKARGTGMGLAVVYGIIKELGGCIDVKSSPGVGSTFKLCIPAIETAKELYTEEPPVPVTPTGEGRRILLVEDDKWVRKSTALLLADSGYEVFEARNAEKALSLFYHEKGRFDLVISDVVMPGRSGLELLGPLLEINPKVPVLLCSGHIDNKEQFSEIISQRIPYIQKPYANHELLQAVAETIEEKS